MFLTLSIAPVHRGVFGTVPVALGGTVATNVKLFVYFVTLRSSNVVVGDSTALMALVPFARISFRARKVYTVLTLVKALLASLLLMGGMGNTVLVNVFTA